MSPGIYNTYKCDQEKELKFAEEAAEAFSENKEYESYGVIKAGEYLAIRWGLGDSVLVVRLDPDHQPTNYRNLIKQKTAEKELR